MKNSSDCGDNAEKSSFERIIRKLKASTKKECLRLNFSGEKSKNKQSALLGSYEDGMIHLLSLNLEDTGDARLPSFGALDFYISRDDTECRVVYSEKFEDYDIKNISLADNSFILKPAYISFERTQDDFICVNDNVFPATLKSAVKTVTGEDMNGDMYSCFTNEECERLCCEFTAAGSKLFGNPCFIQDDERENGEKLLLQLDSDNEYLMFGDYGTAHFFINDSDLKNNDYGKVIYSWECY